MEVNDGEFFIHERSMIAYQNCQWCSYWQTGRDERCRLESAQLKSDSGLIEVLRRVLPKKMMPTSCEKNWRRRTHNQVHKMMLI